MVGRARLASLTHPLSGSPFVGGSLIYSPIGKLLASLIGALIDSLIFPDALNYSAAGPPIA